MEILDLKDLNLVKSIHYKEELHPRDRKGMFAKKHSIASSVVMEEPKKPLKATQKTKPKASTPKKILRAR